MKHVSWMSMGVIVSLLAPSVSLAAAASSSGDGGSITIETLDAKTGKPIPNGLLRPKMNVILQIHAFDAQGNSIPCTPTFEAVQGFSGTQIQSVETQPDGTGLLKMGKGFGSAEVKAQCAELPNVTAKLPVMNKTLMTPAEKAAEAAAEAEAPAAGGAEAGGGSAATGVLIGLAAAAGVTALVIGLSNSSPCTAPELWCKSQDKCCPSGYHYYCTGPSNRVGCYADVFISGCNEKVFCTSEY